LAAILDEPWPVIALTSVGAVAIVFLHRANIARLRAGTENRFTLRRRKTAAA
jgi:glycerol-3-phosphate acyltransferase PlsY